MFFDRRALLKTEFEDMILRIEAVAYNIATASDCMKGEECYADTLQYY